MAFGTRSYYEAKERKASKSRKSKGFVVHIDGNREYSEGRTFIGAQAKAKKKFGSKSILGMRVY